MTTTVEKLYNMRILSKKTVKIDLYTGRSGLITLNIMRKKLRVAMSKVLAGNCETSSDRDLRKIPSLTTGIGTYDHLIAKMKVCPREYAKDRSEVRENSLSICQRIGTLKKCYRFFVSDSDDIVHTCILSVN